MQPSNQDIVLLKGAENLLQKAVRAAELGEPINEADLFYMRRLVDAIRERTSGGAG